MMSLDRNVAGLTCRQVLERLSDFLDHELVADDRDRVEAHLAQCQECLRFGHAIGAMVRAVRGGGAADLSAEALARLADKLGG
jgi:anti-sigma factor RsiW